MSLSGGYGPVRRVTRSGTLSERRMDNERLSLALERSEERVRQLELEIETDYAYLAMKHKVELLQAKLQRMAENQDRANKAVAEASDLMIVYRRRNESHMEEITALRQKLATTKGELKATQLMLAEALKERNVSSSKDADNTADVEEGECSPTPPYPVDEADPESLLPV